MATSSYYAHKMEMLKKRQNMLKCKQLADKGNFISALKELADFNRDDQPRYVDEIVSPSLQFCVSCTYNGFVTRGFGSAKKMAKIEAAKYMWNKMDSLSENNNFKTEDKKVLPTENKDRDSLHPQPENFLPLNNSVVNPTAICDTTESDSNDKESIVPQLKSSLQPPTPNKFPRIDTVDNHIALRNTTLSKSTDQDFIAPQSRSSLQFEPKRFIPWTGNMKKSNALCDQPKFSPSQVSSTKLPLDKVPDECKTLDDEQQHQTNYVGILQEFCMKKSQETPVYDYLPVKGLTSRFSMTCTYKNIKVQASGRNLKDAKIAAALEMLRKLGVLSQEKRHSTFEIAQSKKPNYYNALHNHCLTTSNQVPQFEERPYYGYGKSRIEVTCTYQGHEVTVHRKSSIKAKRAAALEMLEKVCPTLVESKDELETSSSSSVGSPEKTDPEEEIFTAKNSIKINPAAAKKMLEKVNPTVLESKDELRTPSLRSVGSPEKTDSEEKILTVVKSSPVKSASDVERAYKPTDDKYSSTLTKASDHSIILEKLKGITLEHNFDKGYDDANTANILQQIYSQKDLSCHRSSQKVSQNLWKTNNMLTNAETYIFEIVGVGETLEMSIDDANKKTLDAIIKASFNFAASP